ncbi:MULTISPECIES: hypothetical protein [unclassified Candidatus Frackibacter]|uniref:hypothetical protein n=1 Tax=unclassified Candidatus Frackibacter TaxID=2648818 RepID=UPI00089274F0|nr:MULTISPECIES: hypothetical protein [unclassified Candidatus Frackibacter]SDC83920.1 hypothetical protein SAMN04515661_12921 [Candidatus Frackibacter sp. WG11]SEM98395.1 hypothetical protein SAMN04488698_13122 [Candidatus Frackibacter sp. WG12]SFM05041.1 hypothetical protein SAMN04488699_12922 [Candidatus Frackibacter sp. WG13]
MTEERNALTMIEEQLDLYQDLVELMARKHWLLKKKDDTSETEEKEREIRDKIAKIDLELNVNKKVKRPDKLRLIMENDSEKLQQFKPVLKELYDLEKKNQELI